MLAMQLLACDGPVKSITWSEIIGKPQTIHIKGPDHFETFQRLHLMCVSIAIQEMPCSNTWSGKHV
jgi:hypothetical protein